MTWIFQGSCFKSFTIKSGSGPMKILLMFFYFYSLDNCIQRPKFIWRSQLSIARSGWRHCYSIQRMFDGLRRRGHRRHLHRQRIHVDWRVCPRDQGSLALLRWRNRCRGRPTGNVWPRKAQTSHPVRRNFGDSNTMLRILSCFSRSCPHWILNF